MSPVAVADLYRAHHAAIFRLCRRYLRNDAEAEDATQETFLAAHKSLLGGSTPAQPFAWLAAIARNTCWERAQRRTREPLGLAGVDSESHARVDAFTDAVRRDERTQLLRAVGELPAQQRKAFVLCEVAGHSYGEAASRLEVSESALESLLVRARRRLRQRLQPLAGSLHSVAGFPLALLNRLGGGEGAASTAATAAKAGALPVAAKLAAVATVGVAVLGSGSLVTHKILHRVHVLRVAAAAPHVRPAAHASGSRPAPVPATVVAVSAAKPHDEHGSPGTRRSGQRTAKTDAADDTPAASATSQPAIRTDATETQPVVAATGAAPTIPVDEQPAAGPSNGGDAADQAPAPDSSPGGSADQGASGDQSDTTTPSE